ncbi:unnamed protein product [Adineta steineri]|uniref:Uncharacterized protein n=2 Tax=Adineta steineri TaxID=433720 RepID=A0A818Y2Y6_9BILA|nr:unnamed protein product [Adineta steineri]CAF3747384.1 unnamed protein product [Adineta steineri]
MNMNDFLAAPEIVRRLTSQDAFENETVTFTCTVQDVDNTNEDEPYSISWFFNDKQIESNNEKYSIDENPKTGICLLTIRHIVPDDEGAYRCVATNQYGSSVTTGFLAVLRRKRSQSPSPSRNASPSRALSPSNNRLRDRSASPLRYINMPMSKLARVTEELESLINPSAAIVHADEKIKEPIKESEEVPTSSQQNEPSITEIIKSEDSINLPQAPTTTVTTEEIPVSIKTTEEVPTSNKQQELPATTEDIPVTIKTIEEVPVSIMQKELPETTEELPVTIKASEEEPASNKRKELPPTTEEVPASNKRKELSLPATVEPEQSIIPSFEILTPDTITPVEENKLDISTTEKQVQPIIVSKLPSIVRITEGEDLDISCSITGVPEPVIHWTKNNVDIREDHRIDIYSDRGVHHLEISDVLVSDQGLYTIHAENSLGTINADCQIEVIENVDKVKRLKVEGLYTYGSRQQTYKAPEFLIKPKNRTVHEGEQFQICSKVIGNPAPQILWVRLDKPLEDDGYHRIYDRNGENYLEIPKISILDAGEYSCIATNMMGAAYSKFVVSVEAMTEPESTSSEMEERSANVSDVDTNAVVDFPRSIASQLIDKHVRQHRQLKLSDQSDVDFFFSDFILKDDFRDEARDVFMNKGDMVEIVDIDKQDKWLVRNKKNLNQICYVPPEYLEMVPDIDMSPTLSNLANLDTIQPIVPSKRIFTKKSGVVTSNIDKRYNPLNQEEQDSSSSSDDLKTMTEEAEVYYANSDYVPIRPDGIALAENQLVDVLDSHDPAQYLVRTRPRKDERPKIGWVEACFLEKKSTNIGQVSKNINFILFILLLTHITTDVVVVAVAAAVVPDADATFTF